MLTILVTIRDVSIPGVPLPVSGEVHYLPESHHPGSGVSYDPEVIDAKLFQRDGTPVKSLPLPSSYHALLAATQEGYAKVLREAMPENNEIDPEIPF